MFESTSVYRAYGAGRKLLYVGCTGNVRKRLSQHRRTAPWYEKMMHHSIRVYATRQEALAVERRAIRLLKPKYNWRSAGYPGFEAPGEDDED